MSVKCVYCGGRGWAWVGVGSNAEREMCDECLGSGRVPLELMGLLGGVLCLASAALIVALTYWGLK